MGTVRAFCGERFIQGAALVFGIMECRLDEREPPQVQVPGRSGDLAPGDTGAGGLVQDWCVLWWAGAAALACLLYYSVGTKRHANITVSGAVPFIGLRFLVGSL
jgi:hypothetical protein